MSLLVVRCVLLRDVVVGWLVLLSVLFVVWCWCLAFLVDFVCFGCLLYVVLVVVCRFCLFCRCGLLLFVVVC